MREPMFYRKLRFDRVVANLKEGKYMSRIMDADYSNLAVRYFLEPKFSQQLGVSMSKVRALGLVVDEKTSSGWTLPKGPTVIQLIEARERLGV